MRIGILDIDTKKEKNNREAVEKYPNPACGKIYGYHKMQGDEVFYPWKDQVVDKLYMSTIFSWSKNYIMENMDYFQLMANEVIIGGSGWDDYTPGKFVVTDLPPEIKAVDHRWTYELYDIDYSIGKSSEGCHVGCGFCMVWRKEGLKEKRVNTIEQLLNPKYFERDLNGKLKYPGSNHLVLMNNNSLADDGFFDDVEQINELKLSVHWDQANDITLISEKNAAALASVNYRGFTGKKKALYFAADSLIKRKLVKVHTASNQVLDSLGFKRVGTQIFDDKGNLFEKNELKVEYDMLEVIPEKVRMLKEFGIKASHLNWYMLIGFDPSYTVADDLERFHLLNDLGCNVFAMVYRDLTGIPYVNAKKQPQPYYIRPLRDWINGHAFRNVVNFFEFDRYQKAMEKANKVS